MNETKEIKSLATVERYENVSDDGEVAGKAAEQPGTMGTVQLTAVEDIYLIPSPSADPQGEPFIFWVEAISLTCERSVEYADMEKDSLHCAPFLM